MAYKELRGNLFSTKAKALVNTVNCVGIMGKGIALEFRRRYPEMFSRYGSDCKAGKLKPGNVYPYKAEDILILNFAVKDHWRYPSKVTWIESCLQQFVSEYQSLGISSVAFPWMGAQNGGIPINTIKTVMRKHLQNLNDIDVEVYDFDLYAPDPLYFHLADVINSPRAIASLKLSGITEEGCRKIVDAFHSGKAKSLAHLAEGGIVSELSIDKLYTFLNNRSHDLETQNNPSQPSLF